MAFNEGSGWFFCIAIRRSMGIRTYWLWTASLIQNVKGWFSSASDRTLEDSKSRSRLTATNLTAGASFHSRLMFSTSQDGLAAAAGFRGMADTGHTNSKACDPFCSKSCSVFRLKLAWVWDDILQIKLYMPVNFPKLTFLSICNSIKQLKSSGTHSCFVLAGRVKGKRLCQPWWPMFWFVPV